ncbi:hypothetical protein [Thalassotalea litorea]|uniref:hypothetical protein n=1 Tax=Thalassotalea litorea TaxID=2020715 RepID=UPI003735EAE2
MKRLRYPIVLALLIVHLFSSVTSAFAIDKDTQLSLDGRSVSMICTGQGVKYIDLDHYFVSGELVFVDVDESQIEPLNICKTCLLFSSVDPENNVITSYHFGFSSIVVTNRYVHPENPIYARLTTRYQTRAPPSV